MNVLNSEELLHYTRRCVRSFRSFYLKLCLISVCQPRKRVLIASIGFIMTSVSPVVPIHKCGFT